MSTSENNFKISISETNNATKKFSNKIIFSSYSLNSKFLNSPTKKSISVTDMGWRVKLDAWTAECGNQKLRKRRTVSIELDTPFQKLVLLEN